jgi:fluoride exporter
MELAQIAGTADGSWNERNLPMRTIAAIAVAGAVGALARYGLDGLVARRASGAFPWGTLVVNVTGCFLLGFLFTLLTEQLTTASWLRAGITIGLLGAYTTFSTWSLETYRLLEDGALGLAAANAAVSLAAGLVALYVGVVGARAL